MEKCFMFGHRDAPERIGLEIEKTVERHYLQLGIRQFYVGGYGEFDRMAATAVKKVKKRHEDIRLYRVIPYHPAEKPIKASEGFDGTFYPEGMEQVPRRFAIVRANEYMIDIADSVICYVVHAGNTQKLLGRCKRRKKGRIDNLGDVASLKHPLHSVFDEILSGIEEMMDRLNLIQSIF